MPYANFPSDIPVSKIDSCVEKVMAQGKSKESAIAICYESLVNKEINYRKLIVPTEKAITDAPDLRGRRDHSCDNCAYFQWLPTPEPVDPTAPISMGPKGICTKFEFETEGSWVCDAWEEIELPEMKCAVFKQADGAYRWVLVSSSAFRDNDGEIVSLKALEEDAEQMTAKGDYGTLDWWHLWWHDGAWKAGRDLAPQDIVNAKPLRLGVCDFSAMHDLVSIESGTFDNPEVGARLAEHQDELAGSRSFWHSRLEPDADGVYTKIRTFSRALLPRGKEANALTRFYTAKEKEMSMPIDKIKELIKKLGGDAAAEKTAEAILVASTKDQQAALAAGIEHKEAQLLAAPQTEAATPEKPAWFLADMKPEEFNALVSKAMTDSQEASMQKMQDLLKEMQGMMSNMMKESAQSAAQKQSAIEERLKVLEGGVPRGFRASQDPSTVATDSALKEKKPGADPNTPYMSQFIEGFVLGTPKQ